MAVQWLRLHASTVGGVGLIPGWGARISHAMECGKKKKKKKNLDKRLITPGKKNCILIIINSILIKSINTETIFEK